MVSFLRWLRAVFLGALNGIARFAAAILIIVAVLVLIGLFQGDGLPGNMVLALDLRQPIVDSTPPTPFDLGRQVPTIMDIVMALDEAGRDPRVKGVIVTLGGGHISIAQAEEIDAAVKRFRAKGKFVIAYSHGFTETGLGDYLTASAADQIWMQPQSDFSPAGTAVGEFFVRGLLDKIQAQPQIVKRADYKSAADTFMEKDMTAPDREQLTALVQSAYESATAAMAVARKMPKQTIVDTLNASPQFSDDAKKKGLVDTLGYDDDAGNAALTRAGKDAKFTQLLNYLRAKERTARPASGPRIALIEAAGEIVDGKSHGPGIFGGDNVIASDDLSEAVRAAVRDPDVKAIVLRVDSPGGSVSASDQILESLRRAQARGKPVVVSMAGLAASGGYYISCKANRIVAEPGTITGSIGVLTGKVAIGKSLGLAGVSVGEVAQGENALFDSSMQPFTQKQLDSLNAQVDATYNDFMRKVSVGRKLPFEKVQEIAKGRVWSGADAKDRGLVDELGGLWQATDDAKALAHLAKDQPVVFRRFPGRKGIFETMNEMFGSSAVGFKAMEGLIEIANLPPIRAVVTALQASPQGSVELRAPNLPQE
jgi:protease-4